jgi:protein SCO1
MTSRRIGLVLTLGGVTCALAATPYILRQTSLAAEQSLELSLPALTNVAPFELTGQDGQPFNSESLAGKVWVADFIFTRCPGACPLMTTELSKLLGEFGDHPDLRMVSITVDPEYDTPEVLDAFAKEYDADPERWHFLTGPNEFIQELSQKEFKISAAETPAAHSLRFILVDRQGDIRGYYQSSDPGAVEKLRADLATVLSSGA